MEKKELYKQFNVKELIENSNAKIDRWVNRIHSSVECEVKYLSLPEYDIYIKGIQHGTYLKLKEDIAQKSKYITPVAKSEYSHYFHVKHGLLLDTILALGSSTNSEKIYNVLSKKLNITVDFIIENELIKYNDLINKLYYKQNILISKQNKTYKPVKYQ